MVTVMEELRGTVAFIVATQLKDGESPSPIERASQRHVHIPRPRGMGMFRAQWALLRGAWPMRRDIDVLHANGLTEAVVALPVAVFARLPVVVWIHNWERPRPFRAVEPLLRLVGRRWRWLAVSDLAAGLVPWRVPELLANPVSADVVPSRRLEHDDFRVVYLAGSDRPSKGFDLLPEIIEAVEDENVRWILYTSRPFTTKDSRVTRSWERLTQELAHRVDVRDRVESVSIAFAEADLVVAPSRRESFNRVIAEAIVNGVPFVASDISPHRQLAERSDAGLLFPLEDPKSGGELIRDLSRTPARVAELSASAKKNCSFLSASTIASTLWGEWRSVAAQGVEIG